MLGRRRGRQSGCALSHSATDDYPRASRGRRLFTLASCVGRVKCPSVCAQGLRRKIKSVSPEEGVGTKKPK